jgi:hypothetical protein
MGVHLKMSFEPEVDTVTHIPSVFILNTDYDWLIAMRKAVEGDIQVRVSSFTDDNLSENFMDNYGISTGFEDDFYILHAERQRRINLTNGNPIVIDVSGLTPDEYMK